MKHNKNISFHHQQNTFNLPVFWITIMTVAVAVIVVLRCPRRHTAIGNNELEMQESTASSVYGTRGGMCIESMLRRMRVVLARVPQPEAV